MIQAFVYTLKYPGADIKSKQFNDFNEADDWVKKNKPGYISSVIVEGEDKISKQWNWLSDMAHVPY